MRGERRGRDAFGKRVTDHPGRVAPAEDNRVFAQDFARVVQRDVLGAGFRARAVKPTSYFICLYGTDCTRTRGRAENTQPQQHARTGAGEREEASEAGGG